MRHRALAAAVIVLGLAVADLARPPDRQLSARAAIVGLHAYQATLSRLFAAAGVACRFSPTCSHYAEACVRRYGLVRGSRLALARVLRCGPWTPAGTVDLPPTGA
jgi:putative membrane protein insertion efficiency factor